MTEFRTYLIALAPFHPSENQPISGALLNTASVRSSIREASPHPPPPAVPLLHSKWEVENLLSMASCCSLVSLMRSCHSPSSLLAFSTFSPLSRPSLYLSHPLPHPPLPPLHPSTLECSCSPHHPCLHQGLLYGTSPLSLCHVCLRCTLPPSPLRLATLPRPKSTMMSWSRGRSSTKYLKFWLRNEELSAISHAPFHHSSPRSATMSWS